VLDALNELLRRTGDLEPAFEKIGEYLLKSHDDRWRREEAPDGSKWAALSPATKALKAKNADKILVLEGDLRGSLVYQTSHHSLFFGTNKVYGAVHQFGAEQGEFGRTQRGGPIPWGDIPARPFLGLSDEDEMEIAEIVRGYLANSFD